MNEASASALEAKAKLEKSRFGTQGRQCAFKILWGGEVGIQDQESWLEAVKGTENVTNSGAWYTLNYADGTSEKFQTATWLEKLLSEKFRNRILEINGRRNYSQVQESRRGGTELL